MNIIAIGEYDQKKYSNIYSLNELKNYKYLSSLETIDEMFDELIDKLEKKEPKLIEEDNSLKLSIETGHTKFKQVNLYINQKEKGIFEKYDELYLIINKLKENEKKQDEKIKILEETVKEIQNYNYQLYERNQILENTIESLKQFVNFNDYNGFIPEIKSNDEPIISENIKLSDSSPYIPKLMRENKKNEINYNINLDVKPFIPKNIKKNEKKEDKD